MINAEFICTTESVDECNRFKRVSVDLGVNSSWERLQTKKTSLKNYIF